MRTTHPTRPAPKATPGNPLLSIENLRVHYGGIHALKGVTLDVPRGSIVAIIGANGAGKTTTLKTIVRLLPIAAGTIRYDGDDLAHRSTDELVGLGVSLVPEGRAIFPNLTVRENLDLGAFNHRHRPSMAETIEDIVSLFPRIGERFHQEAGTLSGGEQQMLAIGRALMARPTLLLLDEPSLGIAPVLVADIFAAIGKIARSGTTVLLVEQNTRLALRYAQSAYVLRTGEVALHGLATDLLKNEEVQKLYLGA